MVTLLCKLCGAMTVINDTFVGKYETVRCVCGEMLDIA